MAYTSYLTKVLKLVIVKVPNVDENWYFDWIHAELDFYELISLEMKIKLTYVIVGTTNENLLSIDA
jgi:hypothetical protein